MSIVVLALAVLVAASPAFLIAAAMVAAWWWLGWPASQMRNYALAAVAAGLITIPFFGWEGLFVDWWAGVRNLAAGNWFTGGVQVLGLELIAGIVMAWVWWSVRTGAHRSGVTLLAGERHRERLQAHRERSAEWKSQRIYTPLSTAVRDRKAKRRESHVVLGHLTDVTQRGTESWGDRLVKRHPYWLTVPLEALNKHAAVVGATGSGKSELFRRLSVGWSEAAWQGYSLRSPARPLTIMVDCKGSSDADRESWNWCDAHIELGLRPDRVMSWPLEGRLDMWQMSGTELKETLHALAKGDHRFFNAMQRATLKLACEAPVGPPRSSEELLQRLNPATLRDIWQGYPVELDELDRLLQTKPGGGGSVFDTDALLIGDLLRSVGFSFDGGRSLADLDALYCVIPGTRSPAEAKAKAGVLVQLLLDELVRSKAVGHGRQILFCVDEFSAVSETVNMRDVVQRVRSLGGSVVVGAQSYEGLGPDENTRRDLLGSMAGGTFLLQSSDPRQLCERLGTRAQIRVSRRFDDDGGQASLGEPLLVPPARIQGLATGHVAYARGNVVQWGHVAMLRGPGKSSAGQPSIIIGRHPLVELETTGDRVPLRELTDGREREILRITRDREAR